MSRNRKQPKKHELKPHHAKPYRKRHIGMSALGVTLLTLSAYFLGFGVGLSAVPEPIIQQNSTNNLTEERFTTVDSSLGFTFSFDAKLLEYQYADEINQGPDDVLSGGYPLQSITLSPISGKTSARDYGSSLEITIHENDDLSKQLATIPGEEERLEFIADYFALKSAKSTTTTLLNSASDVLGGRKVTKEVYRNERQFGGQLNTGVTYTVIWSGIISGDAFTVTLDGLIGDASTPTIYGTVFATLNFNSDAALALGSAIEQLSLGGFWSNSKTEEVSFDDKYLADSVSPAVVKIYLGYCGVLAINETPVSDEYCGGATGSGFLITEDGYIATNGHVVVYEAEDYLIEIMLKSEQNFKNVLQTFGFTPAEINEIANDASAVAGLIAAIYETDNGVVEFLDEQREIWVSLGSLAPDFDSPEAYFANEETRSLKRAELIDFDYAAQDYYTTQLDPETGFSSSDVALLKIDIQNAPIIELAEIEPIQNENITVIGFPGDAENPLVDTSEIVVSTTTGAISSIRNAAGSSSKLFQSDVDASQGNSGGPAINDDAQAVGLLTYRYKSDAVADASKSYIRDIQDLEKLVEKNDIDLNGYSLTQQTWEDGLRLFSENRFSGAIEEFKEVKRLFPSHRLASEYISRSQAAIEAGLEIEDFPVMLASIGAVVGLATFGFGVQQIMHHSHMHKLHVLEEVKKKAA